MNGLLRWFVSFFQPKEFKALLRTVKSNKKNFERFIYSTNIEKVRPVAESYRALWKLSSEKLIDICDTEDKSIIAYYVCHQDAKVGFGRKCPLPNWLISS